MRTTRALAAVAVAAAVIGFATPTARAGDERSDIVAGPGDIARGGQLTDTVNGTRCRAEGGTASSPVFRTARLRPVVDRSASATVTVDRGARPGSYDPTVRCDITRESRTLARPAVFTVVDGVRGGADAGGSTGATPADMAIGGGLVAAAVICGGVFWLRGRSEDET